MKLTVTFLPIFPAALAGLLALPSLGCSLDGDEVSVGRTSRAINLDVCYPTQAACTGSADAVDPAFSEPESCSVGSRFEASYFPLPELPEGFTDRVVGHGVSAASPDGTFWYLAVGYPSVPTAGLAMHVFLYQIDQEGQQLGQVEIPLFQGQSPQTSLVVDAAGTASVSDGTLGFHRYGSGAKLQGVSGELIWLPNLLVTADATSYLIAGESLSAENLGVLSRVRRDGTLDRSNNQVSLLSGGQGLVALTSHEQAAYSLLVRQPETDALYRVLRYSRELEPEWSLALPAGLSSLNRPLMVSDAEGRLLVAASPSDPERPAAIYGAAVDGTSLFAFELPFASRDSNLLLSAERGTPRVWLNLEATEQASNQLAEVDVARGNCETHAYPALTSGASRDVLVTPEGAVFVLTESALVRLSEAPAE